MKMVRAVALVALVLLCISALFGAIPLILNPSGEPWGMPQSFHDHSPFHSFLIPGMILLLANGVLCLAILIGALRHSPGYGWWVAFQGCVLTGWIVVEVVILRFAIWPHYFYAGIGLVLIGSGLILTRPGREL